jgi:NOL1/NOP2/sun family putative RNA methylase
MIMPKPAWEVRMKKLLEDYDEFMQVIREPMPKSIRVNTNKISVEELKPRLEKKGWKLSQPFPEKEIMIIENLKPGELGKSYEHLLGYYYIQEISSMMSILALNPKPGELMLDLCASPGSKTTQASAMMKNQGTIIANDKDIPRIAILNANLERTGCSNVIVTRHDGVQLCMKLKEAGMKFDKILLDVPCSGEGNIRSNNKTWLMWNPKAIQKLARQQRILASSAIELLKEDGELVYSTCTHSPEENEANVNYLAKTFNLKVEKINLPIKCREGISEWGREEFNNDIKNCCRIYPQDNNTEGFFLAKLKRK